METDSCRLFASKARISRVCGDDDRLHVDNPPLCLHARRGSVPYGKGPTGHDSGFRLLRKDRWLCVAQANTR